MRAAADDPTPPPESTPMAEPTAEPTPEPTDSPTPEPTATPTPEPTETPTEKPTETPTPEPTERPTPEPTERPTPEPRLTVPPITHTIETHSESSSSSVEFSIGTPTPTPTGSPGSTPTPSPTPNPWRQLTVATKTLAAVDEGEIEILASFAAARRDGTRAAVCVSFKNVAPKVATRVVFNFGLIDGNGGEVGTLVLDRKGTFSPGIDIEGYRTLASWSVGGGNHGYNDNCMSLDRNIAALPILSARYATYAVKSVEYADGTVWNAPAHEPQH
jgi:hypothetical protein